ncbi:TldD/PmbA family protein [Candidatus Nitrosotenuis cloacae]|uniref:TldD/PmbA family protein n=1 Tax=Candidatus Nitrosotenuis cloacae TaxID=1603555 RepID=UPI00227FE6F0|nr:TldD/PmbA family protein [Candidatus Nitrosotenuis cloacae]
MPVCDDVIAHSKKAGSDECEAAFCSKRTITVRITDSEIAEVKENEEQSVGVRLVRGKRISVAHSTSLDAAKLVDGAMVSMRRLSERKFWKQFPQNAPKYQVIERTNDPKVWNMSPSDASDIAQEMINSALHQKVTSISGSLNVVCEEFELQNTSGLQKSERATYVAGVINSDSSYAGRTISGIGQDNSRTLAGFDARMVGSEATEMCVNSLSPQKAVVETTSIIFEPMAVGELLTFVFAPNFFLKTYSENRSCFSEKIGTKVAVDGFTLSDSPHMADGLGSRSFDDEGVPTRTTHYIRDGIFENTYSDCYTAFKEGVTSSGNASRQGSPLGRSSEPIPFASPHNMTINAGRQGRGEVVRETKSGLVVSRLWYTYAVNPIKGDFSCTTRSGIWNIENGEITTPARPVRIIHNLQTLLQNISAVADNARTVLSWAASPVTAPSIRCDGIAVSPI